MTNLDNSKVIDLYSAHPYPVPLDRVDTPRTQSPALMAPVWWPDETRTSGTILVAGCGANQAAELAAQNPNWHVTGIDISPASLAHEADLKARFNIPNLDLHELPIEDAGSLNTAFDIIVSTGVLHHTQDPEANLRLLAGLLKDDGIFHIMVYGQHGRAGLYMIQSLARDLELNWQPDGLERLKLILRSLPDSHPEARIKTILDRLPDNELSDRYLHPRDRAYTVPQIFDFLSQAHMQLVDWVLPAQIEPAARLKPEHPLFEQLTQLNREKRWSAAEALFSDIIMHEFWAVKTSFPSPSRYDFSSPEFQALRPRLRPWLTIKQEDSAMTLQAPHSEVFRISNMTDHQTFASMNGTQSIFEIAAHTNQSVEQLRHNLKRPYAMGFFDFLGPESTHV